MSGAGAAAAVAVAAPTAAATTHSGECPPLIHPVSVCWCMVTASGAVIAPECECLNPTRIAPGLGGQTLTAGCYLPTGDAAWGLTGQLQLSGSGKFVFATPAALNTDTASVVSLIGGASCADVHWCPDAAATIGSSSVFVGSITSGMYGAITVGANAHVTGQLTPGNTVLVAGAGAQIVPCAASGAAPVAAAPLASSLVCTAGNTLAVSSDLGGLVLAPVCVLATSARALSLSPAQPQQQQRCTPVVDGVADGCCVSRGLSVGRC
jgi:hypothetical protein